MRRCGNTYKRGFTVVCHLVAHAPQAMRRLLQCGRPAQAHFPTSPSRPLPVPLLSFTSPHLPSPSHPLLHLASPPRPGPPAAEDGYPVQVTGGGPMQLTGDVILCSRSDDDSQRHFDGKLAYLGLYGTGG